MNVSKKKLRQEGHAIVNAIASADVDQEDRERIAGAVGASLDTQLFGFSEEAFVLLASDPLVPCAGVDGEGCEHGRVIRIPMHLSSSPDGRSEAWEQRAPYGRIRCVTCGAKKFVPGYAEATS